MDNADERAEPEEGRPDTIWVRITRLPASPWMRLL